MLLDVLLILLAWFIEIPLWLSILMTCIGALYILVDFLKIGIKLQKMWSEDNE